jgi:nicotinate-nucleotide pyrophosphorylase (carboxylating)
LIEYPRQLTLPVEHIKAKLEVYLFEDAPQGDFTALGTIDPMSYSTAIVEAEEDLIFAGEPIIRNFFPDDCEIEIMKKDGDFVKSGEVIAEITGLSQMLLTRERVLLNLIQRLSGIATLTNKYVEIAKPHQVKILDTRKTTPGLRLFEKYAVAIGGGYNHRLDLSSGILIKDNHIKAAGGIWQAVEKIKKAGYNLPIELEVETIDDIRDGMEAGVDGFLLDNMPPEKCMAAVQMIRKYVGGFNIFIEASGGINLETLPKYVKTGIDAVSIGALTHSVKSSNIHIEFE